MAAYAAEQRAGRAPTIAMHCGGWVAADGVLYSAAEYNAPGARAHGRAHGLAAAAGGAWWYARRRSAPMTDNDDKPRRHVSLVHGYRYLANSDGSIEFDDDVPPEVRAEIIDHHARAIDYEAKRRELWGEIGPAAMTRLAKLFPSLREAPGVDPWDSIKLLDWLCSGAATSGNTAAGLFVLGVWNDLDWVEVAHRELPKRQCGACKGLGVVDRDGDLVHRGAAPGTYTRTQYDDDTGEVIGERPVQTKRCDGCDGKGTYKPAPSYGRFNLFRALGVWDRPHRDAFELWVRFPFWP